MISNGQIEGIFRDIGPVLKAQTSIHVLQTLNDGEVPYQQGKRQRSIHRSKIPLCCWEVGEVVSLEAYCLPQILLQRERNRCLCQLQRSIARKCTSHRKGSLIICASGSQVKVENHVSHIFCWDMVIDPVAPALCCYGQYLGFASQKRTWSAVVGPKCDLKWIGIASVQACDARGEDDIVVPCLPNFFGKSCFFFKWNVNYLLLRTLIIQVEVAIAGYHKVGHTRRQNRGWILELLG